MKIKNIWNHNLVVFLSPDHILRLQLHRRRALHSTLRHSAGLHPPVPRPRAPPPWPSINSCARANFVLFNGDFGRLSTLNSPKLIQIPKKTSNNIDKHQTHSFMSWCLPALCLFSLRSWSNSSDSTVARLKILGFFQRLGALLQDDGLNVAEKHVVSDLLSAHNAGVRYWINHSRSDGVCNVRNMYHSCTRLEEAMNLLALTFLRLRH